MKIITPETNPTAWILSYAYPRKSNEPICMCPDLEELDKANIPEHHKTPVLEDVTHGLSGSKFFSKLDAINGFWSVHLDHESSLLTTFNTHLCHIPFSGDTFGLMMS